MTVGRPCLASEAVLRALSIIGKGGSYVLGTGDYHPTGPDIPWTVRDGQVGSDCAGFAICWAYKLVRHRPGFNVGPWATISDDINCNSAIEDADHKRDLFDRITRPEPGCLLTYPTVWKDGKPFIGHVVIVTGVTRCLEWDATHPDYSRLDTAECHGPNGFVPGVVASTGALFNRHDALWPKPQHRTVMLRARPLAA